jgi:hypothetical protein
MTTKAIELNLNTQDRLARLDQTVRDIITVLSHETQAVKAIDINAFTALQEKKSALFEQYQTDINALLLRKDELKTLPDPVKEKIRLWERELSVARLENMSHLERAGKSFARLRDRIVQVAKESALRTHARYGASGSLELNSRRTISTGVQDHV